MASIALPRIPESGQDFEDYVAGLFQASGHYVERNVRQRGVTDVLELDAVATSYDGPVPMPVLAEAKGGRWGFPDLFKVRGWMAYLGIERSGFFVREPVGPGGRDLEHVQRTMAPLGVTLVDLGDFRDPAARLAERGFRPYRDARLVDLWCMAYRAERALLDGLRRERRAHDDRSGAQAALLHHDLVNDHVFFLKDVGERLRRLYAAYREHPKISLTLAVELTGGRLAPRSRAPLSKDAARVLSEAMYEGKHEALQGTFYVEHRGRLSILKAAIDLACAFEAGALGLEAARAAVVGLPATFRRGLRAIRARPSYRRYALLWQVFLTGFGGFYRADREHEEFERLSDQTGIPRAEIGEGLRAFDELFPLPGTSWIVPVRGTRLRIVKMVPAALRGVGAMQRLRWHDAQNYDEMGLGPLGRRNLITWHNALVRSLAAAKPR